MASSNRGTRSVVGVLVVVGVVLALVLTFWVDGGGGKGKAAPRAPQTTVGASSHAGQVRLAALPAEARRTVGLIEHGGHFPYSRDGVTFGNHEGILPPEPNGYYKEYTVPTPGSADRGARRLVLGEGGELYYSADHYRTFRLVLGAKDPTP
jgi:ribonuclease T1